MLAFKLLSPALLISILLISCSEDILEQEQAAANLQEVDPLLWTYFDRFEREANVRGIALDLNSSGITADIQSISEDGVAGTCHFSSQNPNRITIDKQYWNQSGDLGREFVVFHELGHCILLRGHSEIKDPNGVCASIMASGTGNCLQKYSTSTRDYYLDELFYNSL